MGRSPLVDSSSKTNRWVELLQLETVPVYSAPSRAGPKSRKFKRAEIDKMHAENFLECAQIEQTAPKVFGSKKAGTLQLCVNFCRLNAVTQQDFYQLPRMDEWKDWLGDTANFSTLDADGGYWQIENDYGSEG